MLSPKYRYDILHLLPSLPNRSHRAVSPASSTGWTDMPSDAEDTFFLSGDEGDEYEREKKRRRIDAARERRVEALKTRMAEEEEARKRVEQPADDVWGDDDEEVSPFALEIYSFDRSDCLLSASGSDQDLDATYI
jgi:hypothetical protein